MSCQNDVFLIGNVGKDPDIRYLDNGHVVTRFDLATKESFTDKYGEATESTDWHHIVGWNAWAKVSEKYIRKGSRVQIHGKLKNRSWMQDGITRYITEIVVLKIILLSSKPKESESHNTATDTTVKDPSTEKELDDLPF